MRDIKYSIIIPHKNTPHLLTRCLATIPEAEEFQVIIVDDASDPDLVDFEKFPGGLRANTEIYFDKKGKGAGYARNIGMQYAKGKWLIFADADDFYNGCFVTAIERNFESEADIIYFSATSVDSGDLSPGSRHLGTVRAITNYNSNDISTIDGLKFSNWEPWARLFNHGFIRDKLIQFDEVMVGNDAGFVLKAGFLSKTVAVDKSPICCVTFRKESISFIIGDRAFFERFKAKVLVNNYMIDMKKSYYRPLKDDILESRKYGFVTMGSMLLLARRYLSHKLKMKLKATFVFL